MTANQIYELLLSEANEIHRPTCDGLIAGDGNKPVQKLGVCFKFTAELIAKAMDSGIDMVITHEPTFVMGDRREDAVGYDRMKWELLDRSGIALYRFHDHAHDTEPDYIHAGFLGALDLQIKHKFDGECLGICRYELADPFTVRELAGLIKNTLNVETVRVVGNADMPVKTLCLGLGGVGFAQIEYLRTTDCDVFLTGETDEVCVCEYIRDACFFGKNKAVMIFGHYGAEYAGMRLLAKALREKGFDAEYMDCGEVFRCI